MAEQDKTETRGRPKITEERKKEILIILEPYLKGGLSVYKACLETGVPSSTVYDAAEKDPIFSGEIKKHEQFLSVMANNAAVSELHRIMAKQNLSANKGLPENTRREQEIVLRALSKQEVTFLTWFLASNSKTRDEYNPRAESSSYDPEIEIRRLKEIAKEEGKVDVGLDETPENSEEMEETKKDE